MATNPLVDQGTISKVRGSMQSTKRPDLNIIASYLAAEGISMSPVGEATEYLRTLTGAARSPNPYMLMEGEIHLNRAIALADAYKAAMENDCELGDVTVRTDSNVLSPYLYYNCSITGVQPLRFNGSDIGFVVMVKGVYNTNAILYNQS